MEQQDQIEVFWNQADSLTIKQTSGMGDEAIVIVTRQNVEQLMLGLRNAMEGGGDA